MNKEEFTEHFLENCDKGYCIDKNYLQEHMVVLACDCGGEGCMGWTVFPNHDTGLIDMHNRVNNPETKNFYEEIEVPNTDDTCKALYASIKTFNLQARLKKKPEGKIEQKGMWLAVSGIKTPKDVFKLGCLYSDSLRGKLS